MAMIGILFSPNVNKRNPHNTTLQKPNAQIKINLSIGFANEILGLTAGNKKKGAVAC